MDSQSDVLRKPMAVDLDGEIPELSRPVAPDIVQVVFRNKWRLLLGGLAGLVLGFAVYAKLGPSYQVSARILVSRRSSVPLRQQSEGNPTFGERGEHVAIIMSPFIIEQAYKDQHLDQLASLRIPEPVQAVVAALKVQRTAGTDFSALNVLDLTYDTQAQQDGIAVLNGVIEAYNDFLKKSQQEHTSESVDLIRRANDTLRKELSDKEAAYVRFRQDAPLQWKNSPGREGVTSDATNVHQERVVAIEAERRTVLLKKMEVESKLKAIKVAQARGDSQESLEVLVRRLLNVDARAVAEADAIGRGTAPGGPTARVTMEDRLLPLLIEEQKLLRDYGRDYPEVKAVRASIEAIKKFYQQRGLDIAEEQSNQPGAKKTDFVAVYIDSLNQQLAELNQYETKLTEMFDAEMKTAKEFASFHLEDDTRADEIKRLKSMWELVTNRLSELNLLKDNGGYDMKIIAPPRESLSWKRVLKFVGAGGAFGFAAMLTLVYMRALRDTTLKSVDELRQFMPQGLLARIPEFQTRSLKRRDGSMLDRSLVFHHDSGSPAAETYRAARTALYAATRHGNERVLQVTSAEPEDGKTTFAANLALAMAQSKKQVLLIDADLRCPSVARLFGLKNEQGVSNVLAGELGLEAALVKTESEGLSILPGGSPHANPAELLGSEAFAELLQQARGRFDLVIVDTPPVLMVTDPCIVSTVADGVMVVVRLGKTHRGAAEAALDQLGSHGARLLGLIANGVDPADIYGDGYRTRGHAYARYTERARQERPAV